MAEIIPALLEKSFDDITGKLATIAGMAGTVQFDVCDGVFVPNVTWPFISPVLEGKTPNYAENFKLIVAQEADMPNWEDFDFELDLMIADAKRLLPDLLAIGPARVYFHEEAFVDLNTEIEALCKLMPTIVEPGIAINPGTNPEILFPLLDDSIVTCVQCMGIDRIGFQGQPLDERVLTILKTLRARYPNLPLQVDGGVSEETIPRLIAAGATRLISGSAVWKSGDPIANLNALKNVVK